MKNKTLMKTLSALFAVVMVIGSAPLSGFTGVKLPEWLDFSNIFQVEAEAAIYSGSCGDNLTWSLNTSTGKLVITGAGAMADYSSSSTPWCNYRSSIKSVSLPVGLTSIGNYAFEYCTSLTSVTIPDSVIIIGNYAFESCYNLTTVTIPDSVTSIGNGTFSVCTGLISITIPDSVRSIGNGAFLGCTSLTSVAIPDNVTSISSYAFNGCISLTSVTISDSVTSIGSYAFDGCTDLTSIAIPDSVTSIGCFSFCNCASLTSVTIPDSITSIGDSAFSSCDSLTSVIIGNSVTRIGKEAFCYCTSLATLSIPGNITSIGEEAFDYCENLTDIFYTGSIESWCGITFGNFDANPMYYAENLYVNNTLVKEVVIPDTVIEIKNYAFCNFKDLISVTIPDSVTTIGNYAFYWCTSLTSVTIGDSVTSIGDYAFCYCINLKELTMPASAKIYNSEYTFYNCTSIEKVTLTKGKGIMQNYGKSTSFSATDTYYQYTPWYISGCSEVLIEDGVESIGNNAFYNCDDLSLITIPNSVTNIYSSAFYNTAYYNNAENWENNVLYIDAHLIKAKTSIMGAYKIKNGTKTIADHAFSSCDKLTSVTIGDSVESIGQDAFNSCINLTSVIIGNSVTSVGGYAFSSCDSLTSVTIPDSVTSIGDHVFNSCDSLTSVTIGDSITSIGNGAFEYCTSLTSVTIPNSVVTIKKNAFYDCNKIKIVYFEGTEVQWEEVVIYSGNDSLINSTVICLVDHIHSYTSTVVEPTCTEIGLETFTCLCGNTCTETIPALGHTEITETTDNTCTESGKTVIKCSVCGENISETEIPALGHTSGEAIEENRTESTCTEGGSYDTVVYCVTCGEELSRETKLISAKGHNFGSWKTTTESTMTTDGVKVRECSVCDETETGVVPKTGITIALTDSDGTVVSETVVEGDVTKYTFADVEDGEYTVTVSKETYVSREYTITVEDGEASCEFKLNHTGDINGDGNVNTIDVARVNASAKGVNALTGYELACADINGDGRVNTIDVARINAHAKGVTPLW